MKELINFSVYPVDLERFNHDWQAIAAYTQARGVAGLELLIGYDPPPAIPPGLVQGAHLPFWITWLDVWREGAAAVERYYPGLEPKWLPFYCGGRNATEIIDAVRRVWRYAATLGAAYAVCHVSHVEVDHAFTRNYPYTSLEVIEATADLLNAAAATFPGGEPPVRLFLENLWWPGLTFTDNGEAESFFERLNFDNWAFVLDTGHLMNTSPNLTEEAAAIDFVLNAIDKLSETVIRRIEGVHLSLSTSGAYQQQTLPLGLPPGFQQMRLIEQLELGRTNALNIDQHRPFTNPRCREIIDALGPNFVTHEFLSNDHVEFDFKLTTQQAALRATG